MDNNNSTKTVAIAIIICFGVMLMATVIASMAANSNQSNNYNYNPGYNSGHNTGYYDVPTPTPTPTPVSQAKFNVYNKELSWGSRQVLVAKHLLAADTIELYTICMAHVL